MRNTIQINSLRMYWNKKVFTEWILRLWKTDCWLRFTLKNKKMKKLYCLVALSLFYSIANAQVTDVFQNKEYFYSTNVLKAEIEKDYTPNIVEIFQDKNDDKSEIWEILRINLYNCHKSIRKWSRFLSNTY